jgi:hypothetical protein
MALVYTLTEAFPNDKVGRQENTNEDLKTTKSSLDSTPLFLLTDACRPFP